MRTLTTKIFILSLCALFFWACEKDEDRMVARPGTAPTLTASQTNLVLTEENKDEQAIALTWTASDFGYPAAVQYSLQFGKPNDNFTTVETVNVTNNREKTLTVAELNNIASNLGLPGFTASPLEVRVRASISEKVTPVYSPVTTLTVTPYLAEPEYPTLYLVGDATEFGWDNTKAVAMFRDVTDPFIFTYTGNLKAGALKFLGYQGKWAPQWGSNGSGGTAFRATEADPDPGSFTVPAAGYYTVRMNLRNNAFSIAPFNASGATAYNSIGIIGAFNTWTDIVPMTKTTVNPHIWTLDHTFAQDTELKFRIAEDWSANWGAEGDPEGLYGKGGKDKANLKVKAGSYRILFNDLTSEYLFLEQ